MTPRRSSVRLLCRVGAAALVAAGALLAAAPAAAAAEQEPPVVSLDPPDAELFLVPTENLAGLFGGPGGLLDDEDGAVLALAEAAALGPSQVAETFGVDGVRAASHSGMGEIDVEGGGTVVVRLPAAVDASEAVVTLDVLAEDPEADPRRYSSEPAAADPLAVVDDGGNQLTVTLPVEEAGYGPEAVLVVDGLTGADPAVPEVSPLGYYLGFTGDGAATVTLEPGVWLFAAASCSVREAGSCPATGVTVGEPFDLVVPPTSLLRTLGFGDLQAAELGLLREDEDSAEEYSTFEDPELLTRRTADSASVNLPADMGVGTYFGFVVEGEPFGVGGFALTSFEVDVAAVPVNPGLHSDTGWVEDVREASAGSTKVVAGAAMIVVAGLITVVAVAPRRRPPAEG